MLPLKELVVLITQLYKKEDQKYLSKRLNLNGKSRQYFELLQNPLEEEIDRFLCLQIYKSSSKTAVRNFRTLKSRLHRSLVNHLAELPLNRVSGSRKLRLVYELERSTLVAKVAELRSMRKLAASIAGAAIAPARHAGLKDLEYRNQLILANYFAYEGNLRLFHYHSSISNRLFDELRIEMEAKEYYLRLIARQVKYKSHQRGLTRLAKQYYFRLVRKLRRYKGCFARIYQFRIGLIYFQLTHQYQDLLKLCTRFEKLVKQYPSEVSKIEYAEIGLIRMHALRLLGKPEQAIPYAVECEATLQPGGFNWLKCMEEYFLCAAAAQNYELCAEILHKVKKHESHRSQNAIGYDIWGLYEVGLAFVTLKEVAGKKNNIFRFLSNKSVFKNDKNGFMIALRIFQVLHLLGDREFDTAAEATRQLYRHLNRKVLNQEAERTLIFCQFLQALVRFGYMSGPKKIHYTRYLTELRESARNTPRNKNNFEVIPFEDLVKKTLTLL